MRKKEKKERWKLNDKINQRNKQKYEKKPEIDRKQNIKK